MNDHPTLPTEWLDAEIERLRVRMEQGLAAIRAAYAEERALLEAHSRLDPDGSTVLLIPTERATVVSDVVRATHSGEVVEISAAVRAGAGTARLDATSYYGRNLGQLKAGRCYRIIVAVVPLDDVSEEPGA